MTLPKNVADAYPVSPMQRLMLLHAISAAGNDVLLNHVCYHIRGPLDSAAFHRAWDALVTRHAALRTAFLWEGLPQPLQVVRTAVTLPFRHVDLTSAPADARAQALEALRREDIAMPMVLGKAPLMRCTLAKLGPEHHYFSWAVHHLVVDRWSHAVLFGDLRALYAAFAFGDGSALGRPAAFREYIAWIARQDRAAAERFWREDLRGFREPTLLAGVPASPARPLRRTTRRVLSREMTAALRECAARRRTTLGAMMLSAVAMLVAARTARDDVLCGITVSGRPPDLPDADTIVGSFVNNLPARLLVRREQLLGDWVRDVQRAQARRQGFAHVSLADIHAWSELPAARPLFDTLILLNLTDESDMPWPGIDLVADRATLDAGYPLLLSVTVADARLELTLVHDATLAAPDRLVAELEATVGRVSAADDGTLVGALLPTAGVSPIRTSPVVAPRAHAPAAAPPPPGEDTAHALLRAWRDVLGIEDIDLDDSFFALGGTSLQAAQLFARVEAITGSTLPLSTLFGAGSVRALLESIDRPLPRNGSLVRMRSSGTRPPLYAVPGIGGNVVGLAGLARALGPDQPFHAFESPGLDGREPPLSSIEAIGARYAHELADHEDGPFHLFGQCWGAAVVAEMTKALTALGRPPAAVALLNPAALLRQTAVRSGGAEGAFLRSRLELYWDEFREGDWRDRTRMLASKARRAAQLLASGDTRRQTQSELHQFSVTEANTNAILRYVPARLEARARLFLTRYRREGEDPRLEWRSLIDPEPSVVAVPGIDSGDAISPANVAETADALREWLRAASDDAARVPARDRG